MIACRAACGVRLCCCVSVQACPALLCRPVCAWKRPHAHEHARARHADCRLSLPPARPTLAGFQLSLLTELWKQYADSSAALLAKGRVAMAVAEPAAGGGEPPAEGSPDPQSDAHNAQAAEDLRDEFVELKERVDLHPTLKEVEKAWKAFAALMYELHALGVRAGVAGLQPADRWDTAE